ncbi:MAG: sulfurtransferase [Rhodospirillales bacterium]|nr:sulfurtransferase [Rhodospirillales bacterium]MDE0379237.1 sulfurtransferase [Rhodospirillales bacterium]
MTEGRADLSAWREPQALIETGALEASLGDPALRILDCTTWLKPAEPGDDAPYRVVPGRAEYDAEHIPGAVFLDIQGTISDPDTRLRFMAPSPERFADAMGALGVGDDSRVVLYAAGSIMWATRVWWMLRAFGFERAAVLDGGWEKWKAEGRPVSTEPGRYPPARFTATLKPGRFVDSAYVRSRLGDADAVMVNALAPEFHLGEGPSRYGRPGRIPGSVNVPAATLLDPASNGAFVSLDEARQLHEEAGITPDRHVVAYCGGGISATVGLFLLHQLGYRDLTLYDGSMGEWAHDPGLPIETGPQARETR